jgi:calcium-dependent protein kinase
MMYILLCGSPPFSGNDTVAVLDSVKRARPQFDKQEWKSISAEAKQMIKALLTRDPSSRPPAGESLQQPWLSQACETASQSKQVTNLTVSNLKNFAVANKLKKASLNVIATQLTDAAIRDLKDLFVSMDEDHNGTLTIQELKDGLKRAGVAIPADLENMMDNIDTDGSGVLDYSEFLAATMDKRRYIQEDVCWRAFKVLDADGNGAIERDELLKLLGNDEITDVMQTQATETEVDAIMKEVDTNGDGKIDFDEFLVMMRKMPERLNGRKSLSRAQGKEVRSARSSRAHSKRSNIGIGKTKSV